MKLQQLTLALCLLISGSNIFAQTNHGKGLIFPLLTLEAQSNIIVTADANHSRRCPPGYTNLLSNTNLISLAERKKLEEVTLKYKDVTSNSGPVGSVFERWGLRRTKYVELTGATDTFWVACFSYTSSTAQEEIRFRYNSILAKFRTKEGDGYDVVLVSDSIITYQEYKRGALDGLFVALHDSNHPNNEDEHLGMWTRFIKGKVLGKFIIWQRGEQNGDPAEYRIGAEAEFKEPFDFLKYQSIPIDFAWTEVPINITNSLQNPP
jgi:hypothetical protein